MSYSYRSKRAKTQQTLSAITAALQYDDSMDGTADTSKSDREQSVKGTAALRPRHSEEQHLDSLPLSFFLFSPDEMEDDDMSVVHARPDDADSSPYWQLLEAVQNVTDNQGTVAQSEALFESDSARPASFELIFINIGTKNNRVRNQ